MSCWREKILQNLQSLHLLRSAHFLNIFAKAVSSSTQETTTLFEELLGSLRCLGSGVSVGMVLMDYRVQMTATKALVSEVFSTLATANALVELEGAFMLHSELQTRQVLLGRLYNLYVDNITAVLCACLKLCKQHLEFLGMLQQAANFKGGESGAASAPTQCVHLKISLSWKSDYERLFDSVVELVADFEEQVQLQISG
ncbi:uncharacterized protein LOC120836584 [Ixodes scapularis]|uniref:uncharacterized protein LOC120836584 n=1 Tax=Ixodes scapularis TaxID=6945 RepID=UPI001A9ED461|nr:uncharacterized protein LOC120836584 [Ixodes scapularis]